MQPEVVAFFDKATCTVSYIVAESGGSHCAIIDSVLDFDARSGRTSTGSADRIIAHVQDRKLTVDWILETHAHADHLTAAPYLQRRLGGRTGIGRHVAEVQQVFKRIYNLGDDFAVDGSQFDCLFDDGDEVPVGGIVGQVLATPGHTPACVTYRFGDAAFVGDTIFMPDYGSARCDFPGGDAAMLYRSVRRLLSLPSETRLFTCHDYAPGGRDYAWETTVAEQRAKNLHMRDGVSEADFVKMRTERDRTLPMPALLLPSVQVNIRAGHFPPPEANGVSYLKLPLNGI